MASVKSYPSTVISTTSILDPVFIERSFDEHSGSDSATTWNTTSGRFIVGGFNFANIPNSAVITDLKITIIAGMTLSNKYIALEAVKDATSNSSYTDLGDGSITFIQNSSSKQTVTKSYPAAASALTPAMLKNDTLQVRFYSSGGGELYEIYATVEYELPSSVITVHAGTGGTVTGGGEYESGSTATLTATPNTGYKFKQWSDGNTSNPRTITVTGNATYTAEFEKEVTSNVFAGTSRQTSFGGTVKQTVYKGTTKIS